MRFVKNDTFFGPFRTFQLKQISLEIYPLLNYYRGIIVCYEEMC